MFGKMIDKPLRTRHEDRTAAYDEVMLAGGQIVRVQRASLAAAKALYAAQRAAERRMEQRAAFVVYALEQAEPEERELLRAS